jgi:hypothetical protein
LAKASCGLSPPAYGQPEQNLERKPSSYGRLPLKNSLKNPLMWTVDMRKEGSLCKIASALPEFLYVSVPIACRRQLESDPTETEGRALILDFSSCCSVSPVIAPSFRDFASWSMILFGLFSFSFFSPPPFFHQAFCGLLWFLM